MTVVRKSKHDDAVSPIIGVMLMLVVTIVVAAVVAAFAGGLSGDSEPASIASLKLDSYEMGTLRGGYSQSATYSPSSYVSGIPSDFTMMNDGYGVYGMTFKHVGGDLLTVDDLTLVINYNAAAFSVPVSAVTKKSTVSAGERLELSVKNAYEKELMDQLDARMIKLVYGLGQQNMLEEGMDETGMPTGEIISPRSFDWALLDGSGHTIASGTESTLIELYGY